jgi:predicted acylesterase/phospholipase RssA
LHAGEHLYFSGKFVYAYRFGWGTPGGLALHTAVQASTALPGAFPTRWLRSREFGFDETSEVPRLLALADGGVYDNMADQWLSGLARRRNVPVHVQRPDVFVIANASASMQMQPVGQIRLPFVGEVAGLKRNGAIMYDNSASLRKSGLIDRFDLHSVAKRVPTNPSGQLEASLGVPAGALLDIASDPFAAAEYFSDKDDAWPDRATRARDALAKKPDNWQSDAKWAAGVKTSLSKLGVDTSARLLRHAYTLAAMNLHVLLGMPLRDVPPLAEFKTMCNGRATRT